MKPIEDIFGKHSHSDEVLTMLIELHAKGLAGMPYVLRRTRYKRARAMVERVSPASPKCGGLKKFGRARAFEV